ncbi:AAA domain-containing protein [Fodinicola acaciae]|uniref:AAA domain-containing protein n=1 Tax=Fodinicola acaciae TaxID=2681555 RepID=UPI0013D4418F|nr:AAA domain-containing protein [Fodinicola acaciae]
MTARFSPPNAWVEELARRRIGPVPPLALSYLPPPNGIKLPDGVTLDAIEADLDDGIWIARDERRKGWYRVGGHEFGLEVYSRSAQIGGHLLAVAYTAYVLDEVRASVRIRPKISFVPVKDEVGCNLPAVFKVAYKDDAIRRELRRPVQQDELLQRRALHGSVRKHYGQLKTLLNVLDERARTIPEAELVGTVEGVEPALLIRLSEQPAKPLRQQRVIVCAEEREYRTQVQKVAGRMLTVEPVRDWTARPGAAVRVVVKTRFTMRQNTEALERFRNSDVRGNWENLATLLCDPSALRMPEPVRMPERFFCDIDPKTEPLNDAQRKAVAGALATPHAFLVQGPPGTGKTTVISELIQQLVVRGERVLVLAPSHVAVDEVLRRVGPLPGVRALRITWDVNKVHQDLHPYLWDKVGRDLARRAFREGDARRARWRGRASEIEKQLDDLAEIEDVIRLEQEREHAHLAAVANLARSQREGYGRVRTLETQLVLRENQLVASERDLVYAAQEAEKATTNLAAWDEGVRPKLLALLNAVETAYARGQTLRDQLPRDEVVQDAARLARDIAAVETRSAERREFVRREGPAIHRAMADAASHLASVRSQLAAKRRPMGIAAWLDKVGFGDYSRLETAVRGAEFAWQDLATRQSQLEALAATIAKDVIVLERLRSELAVRQREIDEQTRRSTQAEQDWIAAVLQMSRSLADVTKSHFRPHKVYRSELARLQKICSEVAVALEDVLSEPMKVRLLAGGLEAYEELNDVFDGYRRAAKKKSDCAAELKAAHDERTYAGNAVVVAETALKEARVAATAGVAEAEALVRERVREKVIASRRREDLAEKQGFPWKTDVVEARVAALKAEREKLWTYEKLRNRWEQLTADRQNDDVVEDVRQSYIRATNLVCATTKGIVSGGSQRVRDTDYDTLIVDEASRVTDSEFLIGAVRARRWVLVGDEHQLPPHVDDEDERHLHALTAIYRHQRGAAASLAESVEHLAALWQEDDEQRIFRRREVTELAEQITSGDWVDSCRATFAKAMKRFPGDTGDRDLLQAMRRHLVHSLFQRVVKEIEPRLRERMVVQRRMIPALSQVVRQPVYGGDYRDPPERDLERIGLRPLITPAFSAPLVFIDTSKYRDDALDRQVGTGFVNPLEQKAVLWALKTYDDELSSAGVSGVTVSVLAFYRVQATALDRAINDMRLKALKTKVIDVIDAIQGQQSDIVVLSFTRAARGRVGPRFGRWLQDVRRLNVACTRAQRALVLVGHRQTLQQLTGVDGAKVFYDHLFGLFDSGSQCQVVARF